MKHGESPAALARMKYLGAFQVRAGLATDKLAGISRGGRIATPGNAKGVNARNKDRWIESCETGFCSTCCWREC